MVRQCYILGANALYYLREESVLVIAQCLAATDVLTPPLRHDAFD
jgi:hypothetical protein